MGSEHPISLGFCKTSYDFLKDKVMKTPLFLSRHVSKKLARKAYLKYENKQTTGSFKVRGGLNKIYSLSDEECQKGVIAASAGNHAQGVAYAATQRGILSKVVMPKNAPVVKIKAAQAYGAEVILHGHFYDESYAKAKELEKKHSLVFIHPYEDPYIIGGQSSLGFEIISQCPDVSSVVVAIGGGGLISGVATVVKSFKPECKVYGVVSDNSPDMYNLFHNKPLSSVLKPITLADGISVKTPSPLMYEAYVSKLVDDIICVSDEEIASSMIFLLERAKVLVEGSAAAVLAASLKASWDFGESTVLILGGGNVDLNLLSCLIQKDLFLRRNLVELKFIVVDKPGTLNKITQKVCECGGNILQVVHDRMSYHLGPKQVEIQMIIEVLDDGHLERIKKSFSQEKEEITLL